MPCCLRAPEGMALPCLPCVVPAAGGHMQISLRCVKQLLIKCQNPRDSGTSSTAGSLPRAVLKREQAQVDSLLKT